MGNLKLTGIISNCKSLLFWKEFRLTLQNSMCLLTASLIRHYVQITQPIRCLWTSPTFYLASSSTAFRVLSLKSSHWREARSFGENLRPAQEFHFCTMLQIKSQLFESHFSRTISWRLMVHQHWRSRPTTTLKKITMDFLPIWVLVKVPLNIHCNIPAVEDSEFLRWRRKAQKGHQPFFGPKDGKKCANWKPWWLGHESLG